jgi:hypothetical protein
MIADYLRRVGFLRAVLMLLTVLLVFLSPFAGGHIQTSGWPLITTLVAPVSFVIFSFLLCLDMLMTRVFMSGSADAERRRFTLIFRSEALLLLILLASWAPFVLALLRLRPN